MSILSVNGNLAMNYLLQTIFEDQCDFVPARDVFEAMNVLKSTSSFDYLIVDVDYHSQQAWELIEHIKSSCLYQMPVVVLATENSEVLRQKCYEYEVEEIFFKPFNPLDLISAVRNSVAANVSNLA